MIDLKSCVVASAFLLGAACAASAQPKAFLCEESSLPSGKTGPRTYMEIDTGKRTVAEIGGVISDGANAPYTSYDPNYHSEVVTWHLEMNAKSVHYSTTGSDSYYFEMFFDRVSGRISTTTWFNPRINSRELYVSIGHCRPTRLDPDQLLSAGERIH
jgi:hypothetical protein